MNTLQISVYTRCMLLILIPLVCQIVFASILICLLSGIKDGLRQESDSRTLIGSVMTLERRILEDLSLVGDATIDSDINNLFEQLNTTLTNASSDSQLTSEIVHLKETATKLHLLYSQWVAKVKPVGVIRPILLSTCKDLIIQVNQLVQLEQQRATSTRLRCQAEWAQLAMVIVGTLLFNIVLAAVLTYSYAVGINRPLAAIAQNSQLLEKRLALPAPLAGNNEFTKLDRLLHELAVSLNEVIEREYCAIDEAANLICTLDYTGQFIDCNRFCEKLLGLPRESIVGKTVGDFAIAADALLADEYVRNFCASGQAGTFELRLLHTNEETVHTRWSVFWAESSSRLFCVVQDITADKEIEQLKQDFLGMISHDLRSPLTSMHGAMTLIESGVLGELTPQLEAYAASTGKNIERLILFVNDILDFQKLQAGRLELNLQLNSAASIIHDSVDMVSSLAQHKNISFEISATSNEILCDSQKLVQVLVNLLSNSIKYSPKNCPIEVVASSRQGTNIDFTVTDRGPGVPEEFKDKIFDAFEQVPGDARAKGGSGLGLAIAKLIVESHGGTISVDTDSRAGGSKFHFNIPQQQQQNNV